MCFCSRFLSFQQCSCANGVQGVFLYHTQKLGLGVGVKWGRGWLVMRTGEVRMTLQSAVGVQMHWRVRPKEMHDAGSYARS